MLEPQVEATHLSEHREPEKRQHQQSIRRNNQTHIRVKVERRIPKRQDSRTCRPRPCWWWLLRAWIAAAGMSSTAVRSARIAPTDRCAMPAFSCCQQVAATALAPGGGHHRDADALDLVGPSGHLAVATPASARKLTCNGYTLQGNTS